MWKDVKPKPVAAPAKPYVIRSITVKSSFKR
jgi:hypothetical protein